jgi:CheY-like chemotaxis protein
VEPVCNTRPEDRDIPIGGLNFIVNLRWAIPVNGGEEETMPRILIIDDSPEIRTMLRVTLETEGYEIIEAADGLQGKKAVVAHNPDVVLCDIIMPNQEGLETIRQIQNEVGNVRIIAMSGGLLNGLFNPLPIAKRLGAIKTLQKPFDPDALIQILAEMFASAPASPAGAFTVAPQHNS